VFPFADIFQAIFWATAGGGFPDCSGFEDMG
jgi:hypothetical protein